MRASTDDVVAAVAPPRAPQASAEPRAPSADGARAGGGQAMAVLVIVLLATALRAWRIGHQSFWLDEAFTVDLVHRSLGGMLGAIPHTESTPPLYYVLAWGWSRLFGSGEAALRSLSALFGVATVPVAYAAARRLFDTRTGIVAAALVAVNPYFVWYSQEARAYALLVLLAALSLLALARVLERPTRGALAEWSIVAVLALLTHYFAIFLLVPEAIWLLARSRSRATLVALAAPLAAAAALAPLALHQRATGHTNFISQWSLARRVSDLPKKFVTGELGAPVPVLGAFAGLVVLAGLVLALRRRERTTGAALIGLAAATALIPLALALAGQDYLLARNVIALYVPLAIAAAAGFATPRAWRAGPLLAATLCLTAVAVDAIVAYDANVERDDWRGAAHALGPAVATRAIVLTPEVGKTPLALYAGPLAPFHSGAAVSEIDVLANARPPRFPTPAAPPGFALAGARRSASYELLRYRAATPVTLPAATLAPMRLGHEALGLFVQRRGAR